MEAGIGTRVQIKNTNLEIIEDVFKVEEFIPPNMARVTNERTGQTIRIHKSRIHKIQSGKQATVVPKAKEKKVGKSNGGNNKKKDESKPEKVNFSQFTGEHWTKSTEFDHSEYKVEAHIFIAEDGKTFMTFNTYNGTFGKKGKSGKTYDIKIDSAKYRTGLEKKGYKRTNA